MSKPRLILGDSLAVMRELPEGTVDLVATDPPYFRVKAEAWDRQWSDADAFLDWMGACVDEWKRLLKPGGSLYVFASPQLASRVERVVQMRMNVLNHIVWVKASAAGTGPWMRAHKEGLRAFFPQTERILFAERVSDEVRRPFFLTPDVPYTDAWSDFPTVGGYDGKHPCEKPLPLMEHIITASSRPGDLVLDAFLGSGTTGVAALRLGRRFIGIEKDPAWLEVARKRMETPGVAVRPAVKRANALPLFDTP